MAIDLQSYLSWPLPIHESFDRISHGPFQSHLEASIHLFQSRLRVRETSEEEMPLKVKWSGKDYTVRVCGDDTIVELKRRICELTNVLPIRQKFLYPKLGSKLNNHSLNSLSIPKFTMIGTTEEDFLIVDPVEAPEIIDDLELPQEEAIDIKDMEVNKHKLIKRNNQFKL
ncbi:ubiquitin-like domain-containing CTD phosphatase isoform X2 [Lotus japonicus]|uniref:ubiquitin-like domain-containing CTD phosphatase isoform X2 n=1 Tax=Lotus japonicus TaxID=34305 RepID=UPI0025827BE9|nr:ubiquitin-like domain-containing CTD phosphatase isoform X2 [Lotus japonicus]